MACNTPSEARCDICSMTVGVEGEVVTGDGSPVVKADVHTYPMYSAWGDPCAPGPDSAAERRTTQMDNLGRFDQLVRGRSISGPGCVLVTIQPPLDTELEGLTDTLMADYSLPEEKPETLRRTFVLSGSQ